jgi:Protein of unknown function (DUF3592)
MTTAGMSKRSPGWRGWLLLLAGFFGLFAGLCTVFALVVSAAEAWVEHAQAQWPTATAHVQRCGVDIYTHKPESYWIDCSLSYTVRGEEILSHVHSRSIPAPRRVISQYPTRQFDQLQEWVGEHPERTPITVHYDPANHKKAVLVTTDMPLGGPRTPDNLKLLGFFAVSCAVLLTIARVARPRTGTVRGAG